MSALRLLALLVVAGGVLSVALFGGQDDAIDAGGNGEPAALEHVDGGELTRVVLTEHAAERLAIETTAVRTGSPERVVPYGALIYTPDGKTWVYTSPEKLEFLRAPVEVVRIEGDLAYLSAGPEVGTDVVTVGGAELYGTEFEVGH